MLVISLWKAPPRRPHRRATQIKIKRGRVLSRWAFLPVEVAMRRAGQRQKRTPAAKKISSIPTFFRQSDHSGCAPGINTYVERPPRCDGLRTCDTFASFWSLDQQLTTMYPAVFFAQKAANRIILPIVISKKAQNKPKFQKDKK